MPVFSAKSWYVIFKKRRLSFKRLRRISWSVLLISSLLIKLPETYADYVELKRKQKKQITKEKHEALLNGPEVEELLVFCEEPRDLKGIVSFMNERMVITDSHIFQVILRRLIKQGKMERFKALEKGGTREVFYYQVI